MGNNKHIEVELKFPLNNPEEVIQKLASIGKHVKQDVYQKDTYYTPHHRNFLEQKPISEWLRIRKTEKGIMLNYKNWHNKNEAKAVSCDEFETKIGEMAVLERIFKNLNFQTVIIVEKKRNSWNYKDVEISIDHVTELGWFIEFEAKGNFRTIDSAKELLYSVLKELEAKTGSQDFRGYPYLLLEKKGHKFDK